MNRWSHIYFFDKNGKYYNFDYDQTNDIWTGNIYLPEVSTGLFEVGQLFILQEFINATTGLKKFGYPHSYEPHPITGQTGFTGQGNTGTCDWLAEWETTDPEAIFLFQFDENFVTGTNSALSIEVAGPPLVKYDQIAIPLDYDPLQTVDSEDYVVTNDIRPQVLQINFTINSEEEDTFKRTLIIRDECTGTDVAKITVFGETIGEDERLRTMTENFGYNIALNDTHIFRDTNIYEQKPDFIELNRKRKELMMEGHNIYPFIGSYKGLINAINFFGYNNLQVKEFWKNINKSSPRYGKYIQSNAINLFDPEVNYNDMTITLPNKNFRKTNMFSLIYKINQVKNGFYDEDDLPQTEEVFDYTLEEVLIKLFGLKRKLEKEFLPLNAHIKDITGEADFFGLAELTNTISRNDKRNIDVGIAANFKVSPEGCSYLEDLRSFADFCYQQEGIVGQAIVNFCNAYVAPLLAYSTSGGGSGSGGSNIQTYRNLVVGPYNPGDQLPSPPIGPDPNSILGSPFGAQIFSIADIANVYASYFTRYSPSANGVLPDKPDVPVGSLVILENTSFGNLTWNNIDMTWNQVSNANTFHTFDFDPQGANVGDEFRIYDPVTGSQASYVVQPGDTDNTVTTALYNQLVALKNSFVSPWLFFDISQVTLTSGTAIRLYGSNTQNIQVEVIRTPVSGAVFFKFDNPGEILYTWNSIQRSNFSEIEWTVYKEETESSPEYFFTIRGPINVYNSLPITLPYVGSYNVEMKLFDLYNNISSIIKTDVIDICSKEVEYSGWYQARKYEYTWLTDGKWKWNEYGSTWNLPIEPSVTWDEETPSLYDSLDRVNAILNNFGLGVSPNFRLLNYQDNGNTSFVGPYYWDNLTKGNWNDTYHLWWDLTSITGDTPAFFQFKEISTFSYLRIVDRKGDIGTFYFDPTITTLSQAASKLNLSNDPIINKYIYNVVLDATNNEKFIQAVSRYFGKYGDWQDVDIVDVNGNRICASTGSTPTGVTGNTGVTGITGNTGSTGTGCESLIYRKGLHRSSNPTWDTARFINEGKTLPKMTWLMFVYDKCKINGKGKPKWTIRNTSNPNTPDIYFESKYLTYLFQDPGRYEIGLELTDSNGNKYKKERNILIIK
jgi:hypothetical protein